MKLMLIVTLLSTILVCGETANAANNGYKNLKNVSTDKCLNVDSMRENREGGRASAYTCRLTGNQHWKLLWRDVDADLIKNERTGKCLGVPGNGNIQAGATVRVYDCSITGYDHSKAMIWDIHVDGNGILTARLDNSGNPMCLNIHRGRDNVDGGRITVYQCAATDDQRWRWEH